MPNSDRQTCQEPSNTFGCFQLMSLVDFQFGSVKFRIFMYWQGHLLFITLCYYIQELTRPNR